MSAALAPERTQAPLESSPQKAAEPIAAAAPRERGRVEKVITQISLALTLALMLGLGFVGYLYGLSGLSEHRAQENLRKTFSHSLGQAIAPITSTTEGAPVAALDIPRIGLQTAIVVEGTSAEDLTNGPGHRADSPLPGQAGVSVIYGRRVSFGAPFEHLMRLEVGDLITVTTGQGVAKYKVSSFGTGDHPAPPNSANRLVLTTSDSAGVPHSTVSVSADLVTTPQVVPGGLPIVPADQKGLAHGTSSLLDTLLWSQGLLALAVVVTVALNRWSRRATYLAAAPVAIAVLWNLYESAACLLPNLF